MAQLVDSLISPIENVRSQDVARRAGLTTGAFYHHWPTQSHYRDDLRRALTDRSWLHATLDRLRSRIAPEPEPRVVEGEAPSQSPVELSAALAAELVRNEAHETWDHPAWKLQLAMLASGDPLDAEVHRLDYEAWTDGIAEVIEVAFADTGLRFRPGLGPRLLATTAGALIEGYSLQARAAAESGTVHSWEPLETAFTALLFAALQPADSVDLTVDAALDQVLIADRESAK